MEELTRDDQQRIVNAADGKGQPCKHLQKALATIMGESQKLEQPKKRPKPIVEFPMDKDEILAYIESLVRAIHWYCHFFSTPDRSHTTCAQEPCNKLPAVREAIEDMDQRARDGDILQSMR